MTQLSRTPLWPHQLEQVERLSDQPRVLNAWEMGGGKTLFGVERDLRLRQADYRGPTLVVAPLQTHDGWAEHFAVNAPHLVVRKIDRKNRERFIKFEQKYHDGPADVYIVHYEVLRMMPELVGYGFGHGIFDECHKLQNRKASQTKAAKKLGIPFLTDMSGSPVTTRPENMWSILNHLKPRTYRAYWSFYNEMVNYEIIPPNNYRRTLGPSVAWFSKGLPSIQPFYTRLTKETMLPNLPPKIYSKIVVDLSAKERQQYEQMRKDSIAWIHKSDWGGRPTDDEDALVAPVVIAQLQRLQMFALGTAVLNPQGKVWIEEPSAKTDAVMELLSDNPDEQFVVFSQFKGSLRVLKRRLKAAGITHGSFTGDDTERMRAAAKRDFINGQRQVLLGTIGAGGVGVDGLQHASCNVIFLDRHWSPTINAQAEDRLHRGGQTRVVHVIDVIARDTIDQKRLAKIELTKRWIKAMLGDTT